MSEANGMTQSSNESISAMQELLPHPSPIRFSSVVMFFAGAVCSGVAVYGFSGDWVCSAIGGMLLGAVVTPTIDAIARFISKRRNTTPLSSRWSRKHQCILLVIVVVVLTAGFRAAFAIDKPRLFESAFGLKPPSGIEGLTVQRYYAGGPGDMACLMHFHADRTTMQQITSKRPMSHESESLSSYLNGGTNWNTFWESTMGNFAGGFNSSWKHVPPMKRPESFERQSQANGPSENVRVLWDEETNEAFVLYTAG